jgi:hypothetical protein
MGAIGLIGTVASTGLQLYGMHQQGKAAEQAAKYNNLLAQREADNRERQTSEGIKRQRQNNRAELAQMRVAAGASGVRTTTGTPLALLGEGAGRMEIQIADAARNAGIQADSIRAQGTMGLWQAKQQQSANKIAMLGVGIQGLSSAFGKFQEGQYQGLNYRIGGK